MSEIHDSELYSAATNALASEASSENTFSKIATSSLLYTSTDDFRRELTVVEKTIKSEFGLTKMPSPWRSAKSVILSCLDFGITLLDDNGNVKGKTLLQSEIKMKKKETDTPEEDVFDVVVNSLVRIIPNFAKLTEEQKIDIRVMVGGWV